MTSKIALLPLDGRPCNVKYPFYIAGIAGYELYLPQAEMLGDLVHEAKFNASKAWMEDIASDVDLLILSTDMLVFGGLVHSRENNVDVREALQRLDVIKSIKTGNPHLKIFAFSVIMRLSITARDEKSAGLWADIFEFSKLVDRYQVLGEDRDHDRINDLKKKIPMEIIQDYLKVRQRNHEVNKRAVELVKEGYIDLLTLGVEDSAEYGLHKREKSILADRVTAGNLEAKVNIMNGADEIASMLVVRAKVDDSGSSPRVEVRYAHEEGKALISMYEDRPIDDAVNDHIRALGCLRVDMERDRDIKLYVNDPLYKQDDLFMSGIEQKDDGMPAMIKDIKKDLSHGAAVSVADIKYCNGGDIFFVRPLIGAVKYLDLASYSGFNTTSNATGIALSQALALKLSGGTGDSLKWHRILMAHSLLNDYLYSAVVRPDIIAYLRSSNRPVFDISADLPKVEAMITEQMLRKKEALIDPYIDNISVKNIRLPWKRLFEIDMDIDFGV